ncbi:hypothetical protein [Sulfurimonas sp.]|jgi:hypothetical protein|uniref:hypothetical protein n=1 Tax=Sulfurimonas sp. TaxID=2022749 RepID=UPI0025D742E0|nr:hypothetical protein [Sulfurimonas sp.]MCK9472407.1 hypothetical protein [Sulfurimonas sp.]MDD3505341.1 hypothetical protein [Sulfurimonas sp.]
MRATIIILLFIVALFAKEDRVDIKAQILEKIFLNIHIDKGITLWCDNKHLLEELKKSSYLIVTDKCAAATIIVVENKESIESDENCKNKPIFVLNYELLKNIPESFGAFFWKKGRPNIVIIEPRAVFQNIRLSKELETYKEEKVW